MNAAPPSTLLLTRLLWLGTALLAGAAAPVAGQEAGAGPAVTVPSSAPVDPDAVAALARELAADVAADSVGSVAAAVFADDVVVWRDAFGWEDPEDGTLATPVTIYRAGSLTKTVTALVLLRLVEAGVVGLDDPVADHLPEIRRLGSAVPDSVGSADGVAGGRPGVGPGERPGRPLTFRDLATHTGGLAREPGREVYGRGPFRSWKKKAVAAIPHTAVEAPPGARYRYSNIGYGLLGMALERAAGRPFEVLVDSLVFRALDMRRSSLYPRRHLRTHIATGYVNLPGDAPDPRVPRAEHRGRGYRVPGGGMYSTIDDLARLGMALTGAVPLLPDSLRRLMLTDVRPPRGRARSADRAVPSTPAVPASGRAGYGLGVQLLDLGAVHLAGHSGRVPGYTAFLLVDPERRTGVVLLRSYTHGATNLGAAATRFLLRLAPQG